MIDVEQRGNTFVVTCSVHGVIRPAPGAAWASHVAAGVAAMTHALFVFHGKGAR